MSEKGLCELIVTIVNKGDAEKVVEFSKEAGAGGGTIFFARGTGSHDQVKLFGISIEPEKEVVLTLVESWKTEKVLSAIAEGLSLDQPGRGIAFVLNAERIVGYTPRMEI